MPGPIPPGFESRAEARHRRDHYVRVLRLGGPAEQAVAEKLQNCAKSQPCGSDACPLCVGQFRLDLYRNSLPIFESRADWTRASVITSGLLVPYEKLGKIKLASVANTFSKRLERSSLKGRIILCGIDISLNFQEDVMLGWQPHLYLLIEGKNRLGLQELIKATFPPELTAAIPYDFRSVSNWSKAATYLYKSTFQRRYRYTQSGKTMTAKPNVRGPELRILLPFLDRYPIGTRLILRGIRRNGRRLLLT